MKNWWAMPPGPERQKEKARWDRQPPSPLHLFKVYRGSGYIREDDGAIVNDRGWPYPFSTPAEREFAKVRALAGLPRDLPSGCTITDDLIVTGPRGTEVRFTKEASAIETQVIYQVLAESENAIYCTRRSQSPTPPDWRGPAAD